VPIVVIIIDIDPQELNPFHLVRLLVPELSFLDNPLNAVTNYGDEVDWLGVIDTNSNKIVAGSSSAAGIMAL
jgi:hypothetical protein